MISIRHSKPLAALLLAFAPSAAFAQMAPSAAEMFANSSDFFTVMMDVVVGAGFVLGIYIGIIGLMKLKEYSESGGRIKLSTPIGLLAVSALLIGMPSMISTATETLSLGANTGKDLLSQNPGTGEAGAMISGAITGILLFVKLIGHIAFFRGLLILKGVSEGNSQATMGRALTHIFGGAAAININATAALLSTTLGMPLLI